MPTHTYATHTMSGCNKNPSLSQGLRPVSDGFLLYFPLIKTGLPLACHSTELWYRGMALTDSYMQGLSLLSLREALQNKWKAPQYWSYHLEMVSRWAHIYSKLPLYLSNETQLLGARSSKWVLPKSRTAKIWPNILLYLSLLDVNCRIFALYTWNVSLFSE